MKKDRYWRDRAGSPHGPWCQEKFFPLICKYCHQEVYYFQCSHGCKVYFHKIPSRDGEWDSQCPNYSRKEYNNHRESSYSLENNYEFSYDLSNNNDYEFNYDPSGNDDYEFNYDPSGNDDYEFNYDPSGNDDYEFNYDLSDNYYYKFNYSLSENDDYGFNYDLNKNNDDD